MRTILAWESEEAKEKPSGGGWLYEDRPVAQEHWRKLKPHALEGLAVYQVAEGTDLDGEGREATPSREGAEGTTDRSRPRVRVQRVHGGGSSSVRQLRFQFSRSRVNRVPGQRSLLQPAPDEDPSGADGPDGESETPGGNGRLHPRDRGASSEDLLALARERDLDPAVLTQDDWNELVEELERHMTKGH